MMMFRSVALARTAVQQSTTSKMMMSSLVTVKKVTTGEEELVKVEILPEGLKEDLSDFQGVTDEGVPTFRGVPETELRDDENRMEGFRARSEKDVTDRIYGREKQALGAVLSDMPYKQAARSVNINKFACMAHTSNRVNMEQYWLTVMPEEGWSNSLMGWSSNADPLECQGAGALPFPSLKSAVEYCKAQGFHYTVTAEEPLVPAKGNDYTSNFLGNHIQKKMKTQTPKRVMNTQYKHAERGKSCWVNVKHTPHGKVESKMVSGTQWKNTTSPHDAKWGNITQSMQWESMRKVGK